MLPPDVRCLMYERNEQGTQVLVAINPDKAYVAVVYAGTDDFRNALTDANIAVKPFGPRINVDVNGGEGGGDNSTSYYDYPLMPPDYPGARVHAGFDHAVFNGGLYDRILASVREALRGGGGRGNYRLLITGHSLGAADSLLTSVALRHHLPLKEMGHILNVNFGCPRTGNRYWTEYVNSVAGLSVWRFVNGVDVVPRLPTEILGFRHAGHTVQMSRTGSRAYYYHYGDAEVGYAGVPIGWQSFPLVLIPFNAEAHRMDRYDAYLRLKAGPERAEFYVHEFVEVVPRGDDDDNAHIFGDDDLFPPLRYEDAVEDNNDDDSVDVSREIGDRDNNDYDFGSAKGGGDGEGVRRDRVGTTSAVIWR